MATGRQDNSFGRFVLANATPFLWKRSKHAAKGMSAWNFPEAVQPGQTVEITVGFKSEGNAHGEASYQMEEEEGSSGDRDPVFSISASREGLVANLPTDLHRRGLFAVPPAPHKIAESDWQKGCAVSFTIGALGGDHPNLRGGHTARSFRGLQMAPLRGPPAIGEGMGSNGRVCPRAGQEASSSDRDRGCGGNERGIGGFFAGIGRQLEAVTSSVGEMFSDVGIGCPARPAGGQGEGDWTTEWMKEYAPVIADLKLEEMSIPGTHDSGTAKMDNPLVGPWASTQHSSIPEQLRAGVRALDLRVGYVGPDVEKSGKVHDGIAVVHDTHRTSISLREVLIAVKKFVNQHPSEIVLLDFHRFPNLDHGPPHEKAARVVVDVLGDAMIDPKFRHEHFGKLFNQRGRVAVLWNASEARDPRFWPGIRQAWTGADNVAALHAMATKELSAGKGRLWSLPLVLPAGVPRPVPHIPEQLDDWVAVGGQWQDHASIVSVDFVEETQVVRNCIGANMMKAAQARVGGSAGPSHGEKHGGHGGKHGGHGGKHGGHGGKHGGHGGKHGGHGGKQGGHGDKHGGQKHGKN